METQEGTAQDGAGQLPRPLVEGSPFLPTPWPAMDGFLALRSHSVIALGARSRSREAEAGHDIAVHNAALGTPVLLCAPRLSPRNPLPHLLIDRTEELTSETVEWLVRGLTRRPTPIGLVVIDRLQTMRTVDGEPVRTPGDVDAIGKHLKKIAKRYEVPVLLMARLERPRRPGVPLELDDLGLAAELVYTANTVVLTDRTQPEQVHVLAAKDTSGNGPTPRRADVAW